MDYGKQFELGLDYLDFLEQHANRQQASRWNAQCDKIALSPEQQSLLQNFRREMKVLVIAGAWCGDCVTQCPIFYHFSQTSDKIRIRYFDQETHNELAQSLLICGGNGVPTILFLSEDNHFCGLYGDRTLSKYRDIAGSLDGAACSSGVVLNGGMDPLLSNVLEDWLNEFERIQLMLRTSTRLRKRHGD